MIKSLQRFFVVQPELRPQTRAVGSDERALIVTGDDLVDRIYSGIVARKPVLVTGPRGCGKTYCTKVALKRAREAGVIAGWHFLQGNREIPRDYLSEDSLVIDGNANPKLIQALAIRSPMTKDNRYELMAKGKRTEELPWPGVPAAYADSKQTLWNVGVDATGEKWPTPWVALFLDEINRFGDGFLDSLLSLLEEGVVVRRGEELHVPVVVVATANPPGYDITAKKLSPPLQARIARSYRVSQPPLDHQVHVILSEKVGDLKDAVIDDDVRYLAAGITLCLWGDPDAPTKGNAFLTRGTKALLRSAMEDPLLAVEMKTLSSMIVFGPDARAVADWVSCAHGWATARKRAKVDPEALKATAIEVLAHKLRETFNEGAEPEKPQELERCLRAIVARILDHESLRKVFVPPYTAAAANLGIGAAELFKCLHAGVVTAGQTATLDGPHESRWHLWVRALATLPENASRDAVLKWISANRHDDEAESIFTTENTFVNDDERAWLSGLIAGKVELQQLIESLTAATGRSATRHAIRRLASLTPFEVDLLGLVDKHGDSLDSSACAEWIKVLHELMDPTGAAESLLVERMLSSVGAHRSAGIRLLKASTSMLARNIDGPDEVVRKQVTRLQNARRAVNDGLK